MAVTTAVAVAATAATAYTVDSSNQAKREASQTADAARIDQKSAQYRADKGKEAAQAQAAMFTARTQQRSNRALTPSSTLLTSPIGIPNMNGSAPGAAKTLLGQ